MSFFLKMAINIKYDELYLHYGIRQYIKTVLLLFSFLSPSTESQKSPEWNVNICKALWSLERPSYARSDEALPATEAARAGLILPVPAEEMSSDLFKVTEQASGERRKWDLNPVLLARHGCHDVSSHFGAEFIREMLKFSLRDWKEKS